MNSVPNSTSVENENQNTTETQEDGQTSRKGEQKSSVQTRSEYDGSKPHGVKPSEIEKILDYDRDLKRLQLRFNFLQDEYTSIEAKYQAASGQTIERAKLLKEKSSKERQLTALVKVKNELTDLRETIEEKELASQAGVKFKTFSF
jgi:hypothetical protein